MTGSCKGSLPRLRITSESCSARDEQEGKMPLGWCGMASVAGQVAGVRRALGTRPRYGSMRHDPPFIGRTALRAGRCWCQRASRPYRSSLPRRTRRGAPEKSASSPSAAGVPKPPKPREPPNNTPIQGSMTSARRGSPPTIGVEPIRFRRVRQGSRKKLCTARRGEERCVYTRSA